MSRLATMPKARDIKAARAPPVSGDLRPGLGKVTLSGIQSARNVTKYQRNTWARLQIINRLVLQYVLFGSKIL